MAFGRRVKDHTETEVERAWPSAQIAKRLAAVAALAIEVDRSGHKRGFKMGDPVDF